MCARPLEAQSQDWFNKQDAVQQVCNKSNLLFTCKPLNLNGGDDETRTRDLCRDRAAF